MTLVKFVDRIPGNHTEICKIEMDAVPREGEAVIFNEIYRTVHSVTWNLDEESAIILLRRD